MKRCRWCRGKVRVKGADSEIDAVVHEDGREPCADGRHLAAAVDFPLAAWS